MNVVRVATLVFFVVLGAAAKKKAKGTNQCGGCCNYEVRSLISCLKDSAILSAINSITSQKTKCKRQIYTSIEAKSFPLRTDFKLKRYGRVVAKTKTPEN